MYSLKSSKIVRNKVKHKRQDSALINFHESIDTILNRNETSNRLEGKHSAYTYSAYHSFACFICIIESIFIMQGRLDEERD